MSYYTRDEFSASLRSGTPTEVVNFLQAVADADFDKAETLAPDHPFFRTKKWLALLCGIDAKAIWPEADGKMSLNRNQDGSMMLKLHSTAKNFSKEIETFCDWIVPHIAASEGEVLGEFEDDDYEYRLFPTQLVFQRARIEQRSSEIPR